MLYFKSSLMCMIPLGLFSPSSKQEVVVAKGIKEGRKPLNFERSVGSGCKRLEVWFRAEHDWNYLYRKWKTESGFLIFIIKDTVSEDIIDYLISFSAEGLNSPNALLSLVGLNISDNNKKLMPGKVNILFFPQKRKGL